ncbi:NAD-glutamate dehydrogenase [Caulobacter sp. KR2-114]|uniref:NAD-glutamate dehydrogenase n=1 Tax=Caulobacter sp. KR2-114 TaxID=3400912 RepID=UPI003C036162
MPLDHPAPPAGPLADAFRQEIARQSLPDAGADAFIASVLADYRPEELPGFGEGALAARLADFWAWGQAWDGGAPSVRIIPRVAWPSDSGSGEAADVLEIVQRDAPFLVDSVMGEVGEARASVRAMFHPMVAAGGRRTSMIQVWLEPLSESRHAGLLDGVRAALADVRAAVDDFPDLLALMARSIKDLERAPLAAADKDALAEDLAFLRWLDAGHFVFLGGRTYEYPRTADGGYAAEEPLYEPQGSLGVLRDPDRTVLRRGSEPAILSPALRRRLERAEPVIVAKANLRSRVHRRGYMDYVGVRRYGDDGRASGEVRFVGLFTAEAYDEPAHETPMIRRKVAHVLARAGHAAGSHNAVRLTNILESYPRDELFQISEDELLETALGILHLSDRPRVKLFLRRDPFDRFVSILLYVPRERYDQRLRERAGELLARAFGGRVSAYYPAFSDAPLARVHYIIGLTPGDHPEPDVAMLEAQVATIARTWEDDFEDAARRQVADPLTLAQLLGEFGGAFAVGYKDRYGADEAVADVGMLAALAPGEVGVRAFRAANDSPLQFRLKLYRRDPAPIPLAEVLPILDNMGLRALVEDGYRLAPRLPDGSAGDAWVHEFLLEDHRGERLVFAEVREPFEAAFRACWTGAAENDPFNRLVLELALPWREAALVRALARYRQQSGLDPSQAVQEAAVAEHPGVTRLILDLFKVRFDPAVAATKEQRRERALAVEAEIEAALQAVESLDADRVLRRLAALVGAITRTNYFQPDEDGADKGYIAFKVASRELADLPAPKPFREIFVAAPHVEGVHLRFGPVARGGLRWSDRRDDFRTEVLGLVKAQQVKNAVIVPVGSKGGFFPKALPRGGTPDAVRAEAIRAYRTFLCGLLDLTDNIDADGAVIHPPSVVIHDADDPYLVVAADKGTATFSDIANGVAEAYGFWLGDAFASGGSAGYDHKAMGITARGAWEGVKRHFRELGKDIQAEPFTAVGVGDMSGDVFGNGMLLSKATRLIAAFDHRHVFLDPNPDAERSWAERRRLFDLPRSSWDDYDRAALSPGGGVFARTLKSVPVSDEVKAALDIKADELSPAELIVAILKARVELLYLGGIGTYVKGHLETNLDVGDKANDAVRVSGRELRCKVVGEGANLGFTQAGRIEFALAGGRIDTDAIDNSAGVDTSDHEVNIKILTGMAERAGELTRPDRDVLLQSMTDEVASHVLAHNYDQTLSLSLQQVEAAADLDAHDDFMTDLERRGRLDRALEGLPGPQAIQARREAGKGLTRPELAVLLAYGKLDLFDDVIDTAAPDDPWFQATLEAYFPKAMLRFDEAMKRHRLRREIIATVLGNQMINLCGPTFPRRLRQAAGCGVAELVVAFEAARQVLRFDETWARVAALDGKVPAAGQIALFRELSYVLRGETFWLARKAGRDGAGVQALVGAYQPAVDRLKTLVPAVLSPFEQKAAVRRAAGWIKAGAPRDIAHSVALMRPLTVAATLTDLAAGSSWSLDAAARVYHRVGGVFGFDKLRAAAGSRTGGDAYERLAVRRLIEDMLSEQAALTGSVMAFSGKAEAGEGADVARGAVSSWSALRPDAVRAVKRTLDEIEKAGGGWTFAKLTIANAALRELAGS